MVRAPSFIQTDFSRSGCTVEVQFTAHYESGSGAHVPALSFLVTALETVGAKWLGCNPKAVKGLQAGQSCTLRFMCLITAPGVVDVRRFAVRLQDSQTNYPLLAEEGGTLVAVHKT
jgi:hypothetical protein